MSLAEMAHDRAESRVGELMGVINATTAELVSVVAGVIANETWAAGGIRSVEQWVTWQCGVSARRARELVVMARRRSELPATTELFEAGLLSEDAAAAIADRVPRERDGEVAELAPALLHGQLRRWLSTLPRPCEAAPDAERARDLVSFGSTRDRWRMRVDVPIDEGKVIEKALAAGRSQVFHERHPDEPDAAIYRSGVTWADGLARMAELALCNVDSPAGQRRPGDRYQVLVHWNVADRAGRWHMGDVIPDAMRCYLSCDADVRTAIESDGMLVALSSRLRTVDDKLRAFVEHRDGGCVVPGCAQQRWLHIHHLEHWEHGGRTESPNLCALCPRHHRLLHAGELHIDGDPSTPFGLTFRDRHGRPFRPPPPVPPGGQPPDPPPRRFRHPTGEPIDWRYIGNVN
ncbi:MAG TPA: DUF222 domain-containing protein [Acidimicrobiales bacterium]